MLKLERKGIVLVNTSGSQRRYNCMNNYKVVSEEEYTKREKRMDKILKKYEKIEKGNSKNVE